MFRLFAVNTAAGVVRSLAGWIMVAAGLYMLAAVVGACMPRNANWLEAPTGTSIYLEDNGIHLSIIIPREAPGGDPARSFADRDFPGNSSAYPWLMVGWGDAHFYRGTPRWADLRPGTALAAITGSGAELVHVDRLDRLPSVSVRRIVLSNPEYARLMQFIGDEVAVARVSAIARAQPGYGVDDRFYPTTRRHRYSMLFTCNNWVGAALAQAGVKTGRWTPLPFGVMWWH